MENSLENSEELEKQSLEYLDNMLSCVYMFRAVRNDIGKITDFEIVFINKAASRLFRRTKEALIGQMALAIWPGMRNGIFDIFCRVLETGQPYQDEHMIYTDDTQMHPAGIYAVEIIKIRDGVAVSAKDITERIQKEKERKRQETDLLRFEREIARFERLNVVGEMAASIGHEVRNPITTVRGYLQMFQMKPAFAKYREDFSVMIEELDRANTIISDFLSLVKAKELEIKPGNLKKTILAIYPLLQADAVCRGHELNINIADVPDIEFDDKEIRQLILNLVRNSLEAMEKPGKVYIRVFQNKDGIKLEVRDTGPGIPDEVMVKLGTPFVTTKANGTGLGLSVCYRIAERHGAKIEVISSSQGTIFHVVFALPDRCDRVGELS